PVGRRPAMETIQGNPQQHRTSPDAQERPPMPSTTPSPARVLVVEDQGDVRESLLLLLSCRGYEAQGAADGAEGLALALLWRPEVVISDIGLPGLDGWALAEQLRNRLGWAVFLVALTGYARPVDRERSLAVGFDAHLAKPADPEALLDLLAGCGRDSLGF